MVILAVISMTLLHCPYAQLKNYFFEKDIEYFEYKGVIYNRFNQNHEALSMISIVLLVNSKSSVCLEGRLAY